MSVRDRLDHGAGKRPARVPLTATPRRVTLDLSDAFVDRLIQLGHLRQDDREDRNQILLALYRFLDYSALGDVHP